MNFSSVVVAVLLIKSSLGFQAPGDGLPKLFRDAVDESLNKDIICPPVIEIMDDDTFSPRIPCSKSITPRAHATKSHSKLTSIMEFKSANPVSLPLSLTIKTKTYIAPTQNAKRRKVFGIDDEQTHEYWFNNRIHTLGNTGLFGGLHAAMSSCATSAIDILAYKGEDVRTKVCRKLRERVGMSGARVLDMCCGVGISTRALLDAFDDAEIVVGLDTSPEMIGMARFLSGAQIFLNQRSQSFLRSNYWNSQSRLSTTPSFAAEGATVTTTGFARGNAERTKFSDQSFDLVTIMYAFHEVPKSGRYRVLREARRLLKDGGTLALLDISPDFVPCPSMLAGEPYVLEYQKNIHEQMKNMQGFGDFSYENIVDGQVSMWTVSRQRQSHRDG